MDIKILFLLVGGFIGLFIILYYVPVNLWFTAVVSGVKVSIPQLILMRIRKVPPALIVNASINSNKAGLNISVNDMETHFLAGGNVNNVVKALISADKANIALDFKTATAIDLAGR